MKTYIILFLATCFGIVACAQDRTPYLTKSLSAIKHVSVSTSGGITAVSGASGD